MITDEMKVQKKEISHEKIDFLLKCIEKECCIVLHTPKDYDRLAMLIFQKTHARISVSTLKRVMGYLPESISMPSASTLNILARYVGYTDFDAFADSFDNVGESITKGENIALKREIRTIRQQLGNIEEQLQKLEQSL